MRREGLPPDQMLIRLKRALDILPNPDGDNMVTRYSIHSRIISFPIRSHFANAD